MDLIGQIVLLFAALIATTHCLQDGSKSLPDHRVFEMKPPKEFMDLFRPDTSKNLNNPMKSPLNAAMTSGNLADLSKLLPDPSVFELKPPKEFMELFGFKEKKNVSVVNDKDILVRPEKELSEVTSAPEQSKEGPKPSGVEMESHKETADLIHLKDKEVGTVKDLEPIKESFGVIASDLPDKNYFPDPKVFEMKPPKKFLDLFQIRDKENLVKSEESNISHTKIPLSDAETSLPDKKILPDPSVFEMKPPKEFLDLFQFKHKEQSETSLKEPPGAMELLDEKETKPNQNMFQIKPLQEFTNLFQLNDKELNKPMKWPSWSFETNNFNEKLKFPDWFYSPSTNPQENTNIVKLTETSESGKPHDIHWNQQTFESNSYFSQSSIGDKEFKPFSIGFQNIFSKKDDNDIEVHIKDKSKIVNQTEKDKEEKLNDKIKNKIGDNQVVKSSEDKHKQSIPVEKLTQDDKSAKTNKYSDAIIFPKENIAIKNDNKELLKKPHQPPSKPFGQDNPIFLPVQLMTSMMNRPNLGQPTNYPASGFNGIVQGNNYHQNQKPVFMNVPYGSNRVPSNYVLGNGAPLNGQMNTQIQPYPVQGAVWQNPNSGYNQNNFYALVPVANKLIPYFNINNNVPSHLNGYQATGQVYNLVPAQNNVLLTTKDEEDL